LSGKRQRRQQLFLDPEELGRDPGESIVGIDASGERKLGDPIQGREPSRKLYWYRPDREE
jgi:hypothetical protein